MGCTTKRSHITREASPAAVATRQLNEMCTNSVQSLVDHRRILSDVSVGMPVVFRNSAGCVCTASVMGEQEDNMVSVASEDQRCGIMSVSSMRSFACSQKQSFAPDQGTNDISLGAERPCWE